jgi:hypothetical protein
MIRCPGLNDANAPKEARSGLEAWKVSVLPVPPLARGMSLLGIIGPGAIILGVSIGSGEWLLGPAAFIKYGMALLWVTAIAVFLQTVFNTELIRYTLYTGEPIFSGLMRTGPSSTFWAWFYSILYFLQVGWPGWAGAAAGAIFYLIAGRLAGPNDTRTVYLIGVGAFLGCVAVLLVGRRIERTLEILNWILIVFILGGMTVLCVLFAAPGHWLGAVLGFAGFDLKAGRFNFFPEGADWFLISAFAAYSGAGGVTNLVLSNWARDKGFGMGQVVGFIPAAIGGHKVKLAHTGQVFPVSPESLVRWKGWWRIVQIDQWGIFFIGAFLGMGLPAILYTAFVPSGRDIRGLSVAAELASAMAARGGAAVTFCVAMMGAWILFKTQLDQLDGMTRAVTDILWTASRRVRAWRGGDVRIVYYSVLGLVIAWGLVALRLTQPIILLQLGANMAGVVFVISAPHVLYVNTRLLPPELRPPTWRRVSLVLLSIFYGFFVYLWLMGGLVPDPAKGFLFNIPRYLSAGR